MKQRYKFTLAYDGTNYVGWQHQKNGTSIQEKLTDAIGVITGRKVRPIGTGRTDSGVHALGQVAHVDLDWNHSKKDLLKALNSLLPVDIRVINVAVCHNDFHAQKDAEEKWYRYVIHEGIQQDAALLFERAYAWGVTQPLNLTVMREAAKILIGTHDFKSFQASGSSVKTTVRTINKIRISREKKTPWPFFQSSSLPFPQSPNHYILFDFFATGFLKQMVRNIVGVLVAVGRGTLNPKDMEKILQAKDRKKAGFCAPPHGLYLMKVTY